MIIHGITERGFNKIEQEEYDNLYVTSFLDVLGTNVKPLKIIRLGKANVFDGKKRPVKLVMQSTEDKDQIISRLVNLRNSDEQYKSISVKDDYTLEEQDMITEWVKKQRNEEENSNDRKVRGTPKTGLRLVKVARKINEDQE